MRTSIHGGTMFQLSVVDHIRLSFVSVAGAYEGHVEAAARLMSRIIEARDDCEVHLAHNGRAGMDLIWRIHPDLVITDLMMPDVDGFAVIEKMKDTPALACIPIAVVTAKELTVGEREYLNANVDVLLQKGAFIDDELVEGLIDKLR